MNVRGRGFAYGVMNRMVSYWISALLVTPESFTL